VKIWLDAQKIHMTIRRMRWLTKATDTHSENVILIAFLWQQWLRERASVLRNTYTAPPISL
jgi:hypothetical protein